jgi:hypothetical protein
MLDNKNTSKYLNEFAKYVIQQSRSNLTWKNKNNQKKLYNSLDKQLHVYENSFRLTFSMEDYGMFVDQGVKGKSSSLKAPNSEFRFGNSTGIVGGLTKGIDKWVRQKGIQFRQKEGKGVKGQFLSYSQTSFLIRRSIWHKGIKPSLFFTKPFKKAFERLPNELVQSYGLDVEQFLQYTLNKK